MVESNLSEKIGFVSKSHVCTADEEFSNPIILTKHIKEFIKEVIQIELLYNVPTADKIDMINKLAGKELII